MMRVLNVLPVLDFREGGPIRSTIDLSVGAIGSALRSEIVGLGPLNVPDNGLPAELFHVIPYRRPNVYRYSKDFGSWLDRNVSSFDGVVIHGMWHYPGWAAHLACQKHGVRYACFPHGMLDPWAITGQGVLKSIKKRMYWTLREKRIFDGARGLLFASHREMLNAYNVYPRLERTCRTVPYVVSPSGEESAIPATESLMQPRERKVMLFLGRVHPKKNLPFLLRAWAAAAPPPAWHLVIAGPVDEGYKRDLERLIEQLRMESCVSFVGAVTGKDKSYLLHRAEWFVLPSFQENFAIAALEALYARCPVVLSDQVQIGDALHEESEILPLRLEPWVEFLKTRMTDSAWREHLIERDAQDVLTRFSTSRITTEWISSLLSLFAC